MALKLKVTIDNRVIEKILLNARKTIDGNIIVHDHPEVDIFILASNIIIYIFIYNFLKK